MRQDGGASPSSTDDVGRSARRGQRFEALPSEPLLGEPSIGADCPLTPNRVQAPTGRYSSPFPAPPDSRLPAHNRDRRPNSTRSRGISANEFLKNSGTMLRGGAWGRRIAGRGTRGDASVVASGSPRASPPEVFIRYAVRPRPGSSRRGVLPYRESRCSTASQTSRTMTLQQSAVERTMTLSGVVSH
jgi:hypothetical protein